MYMKHSVVFINKISPTAPPVHPQPKQSYTAKLKQLAKYPRKPNARKCDLYVTPQFLSSSYQEVNIFIYYILYMNNEKGKISQKTVLIQMTCTNI